MPRFCRAFVEWLRQVVNDGTEKGQQQWAQVIDWVNTPPAQARVLASPEAPSQPSSLRAAMEAAVGSEGAAFDAFASTRGR